MEEKKSLKRSDYAFTRRVVTGFVYGLYEKQNQEGKDVLVKIATVETEKPIVTQKSMKEEIEKAVAALGKNPEEGQYNLAIEKQKSVLIGVKDLETLMTVADIIEE